MKKCLLVGLSTGLFIFVMVSMANATLLFEIERFSDNTMEIRASGVFDTDMAHDPSYILSFDNVFSSSGTTDDNPIFTSLGTLEYTNNETYDSYYGDDSNSLNDFYMSSALPKPFGQQYNSVISGTVGLTAPSDWVLNNVGHTGNVYSGVHESSRVLAGTFSIVGDAAPVPEPTTMILFSLGLLGLAGVNRRKQ